MNGSKRGWDHLVGFLLALGCVCALLGTERTLGFPRDEGFYFHAATEYAQWFKLLFVNPAEALQRHRIEHSWAYNHEHPALAKSLFSLSFLFLHEQWKLFTHASTAFRFPGMLASGGLLWTIYLFGARACSRRAGLVAALLFAWMPRQFFHAHLACFDVPVTAMWTLCLYVYWRSQQEKSFLWALATGMVYGLLLETKHNAWLLPFAIVPHALFVQRQALLRELRGRRLTLPLSLVAMALVGPLVFYALWPWLWHNPLAKLQEYLNFHLYHEYYNIEFLGRNYFGPPSPISYAPVMILATVPSVTVLLFLWGAAPRLCEGLARLLSWMRTWWPQRKGTRTEPSHPANPVETDLLLALSFAVSLGPFFLPRTPIFGGTKHWMPAYPVLCLFAGFGYERLASTMEYAWLTSWKPMARKAAQVGLLGCLLAGPLLLTIHSHPFGLSAYTPLVGGTAGAADLGLHRQFWGFTTESAAAYVNAVAPPHGRVFFHDTAWDSWYRMLEERRIRPDLEGVRSPVDADIALFHHELHTAEVEHQIWIAFGKSAPDYVVSHDGVPIVSVYLRNP